MRIKDITAVIEQFAPLGIQEEWDNSGLSVGDPDAEVTGVLVGFDCTPELIDEAIATGCNLVVTHHPLIFRGIMGIHPGRPVDDAIIKAIRGGIAVYSAHTTADKVAAGVSGAMARRLMLGDQRFLCADPSGNTGLGMTGYLPRPMTAPEAIDYVKNCFGLKAVRTSRPIETPVTKVALCGGSGGSMIADAISEGAQLYISADISYHNFFTPEGFMIMDIGHFESEVEITEILFSLIREKFANFAVRKSAGLGSANPVYYY